MRQFCCGLAMALCCIAGLVAAEEAADYEGQDLRKRDFSARFLEGAIFTDAQCFLVNFKNCKLAGAKFDDADVTSASFDGADLTGADFRGATVKNAGFQVADLSRADFSGVDLTAISFQGSKLRGANLSKTKGLADVTRADLREADLRGANLLEMKDYAGATAKFKGAKYDKATRWPLGFDVEKSGAVLKKEKPKPAAQDEDEDEETEQEAAPKAVPANKPSPKPAGKAKPAKKGTTKPDNNEQTDPAEDSQAAAEEIDPKAPKGAPSLSVIKQLLESGMWGPPAENTTQAYTYKSIKYGEPFYSITVVKGAAGEQRDSKTKVLRFPVRVQGEIEVTRTIDGTTRIDAKHQTFHFFKDDFGEWSFKFQENN
ncbi:MAG: pentapeptide repeat-containing protein [Pirellulales bacterium]